MSFEAPYNRLPGLPRTLWLPALTTSAGERGRRLDDTQAWRAALQAGMLPSTQLDFGDPEATPPLRRVVGELGLPTLCQGVPELAEQVLRTLLWHLDRLVDLQPKQTRSAAIAQVCSEFRAAWEEQTTGLEEDLALLQGLGDLAHQRWDALRGQLRSRPWQVARRAADRLAQLPALVALIQALGRAERSVQAPPAPDLDPAPERPRPQRAVETRIPDAPGEVTGVQFSGRIDRMLPAEAVLLRHPIGARLWRARQAEARLLAWQTEAVLTDWRPDPLAPMHAAAAERTPAPLDRGPILLCLDTSGSMRGAPENIAKA
ncbi:MAG: VWA domain-containing protein, partial [Rhodoferax sp.]|nr:VWA domain-containing protein [Rhodoferax sp.]